MAVLYRPQAQFQGIPTDADGWKSCTAYAAAMGVDAVTAGSVVPTGHQVRALTDEPVPEPGDPGLRLDQVRVACARFGMKYLERRTPWESVPVALRDRRWIVATLWYPDLGEYVSQKPPNAFGHAVGLMAIDSIGQNTLLYDPLAKRARWVPLATVRRAMESWGARTGIGKKVAYLASDARIPRI